MMMGVSRDVIDSLHCADDRSYVLKPKFNNYVKHTYLLPYGRNSRRYRDPVMENCLKRIMNEYLEMMNNTKQYNDETFVLPKILHGRCSQRKR
jgi:hypothetical protein